MMIAEFDRRQGWGDEGVLSYFNARAITRVGTEHNEDCPLSFAVYGTASQLDKAVHLYQQQYNSVGQFMLDYYQTMMPADSDSNVNATDDLMT
ncbi:MAG: hypothetical protein ACI9XK_003238 [Granulosicoccus sp.]|jgi:hypothetical protein